MSGGLTRHGGGTLFPYNPEFYTMTTGFYSPGTIYAWYLLMASVILNWAFCEKNEEGLQEPGISTDFLAVVAYPAAAATDGLIHGMRILHTEYRALAIFCLRFPGVELTGFGVTFNQTQLDLNEIPPNVLSLGQHALDLTGPLTVTYTFTFVMFLYVLIRWLSYEQDFWGPWKPSDWAQRLADGAYAYVVFVLTIFHLSLGDWAISFIMIMYHSFLPFMFLILFASAIFFGLGFVASIAMMAEYAWKRNGEKCLEGLKMFLVSGVMGAMIPGLMIWITYVQDIRFVPDLAIEVTERDQLAALIVGIITLGWTVFEIVRRRMEEKVSEEGGEELQSLNPDNV